MAKLFTLQNTAIPMLVWVAMTAASPARAEWSGLTGRCPTCIEATSQKRELHTQLANNAVVYYVFGEFTSALSMWIVDLDQGTISEVLFQAASTSSGEAKSIDKASLKTIRNASNEAWNRIASPKIKILPPGTTFALNIFSGNRMVALNPFDPTSRPLVSALEAAGATTSGSFSVVR
jgi:hypothetical protein